MESWNLAAVARPGEKAGMTECKRGSFDRPGGCTAPVTGCLVDRNGDQTSETDQPQIGRHCTQPFVPCPKSGWTGQGNRRQ